MIIALAEIKFIDGVKILLLATTEGKFKSIPFAITTPEKILELIEKINAPEVEEVAEAVVIREEEKKIATVVTNFIDYELKI